MTDKWVEVDIHLNVYGRTNEVLVETVKEFVEDFKKKGWIKSWHFFREPQIRLRFFGEANSIEKVKNSLNDRLQQLESERSDLFSCHVFGSHGQRGKEYTGEHDFWKEDWPLVMKLWNDTSEFALSLISKGAKKPLDIHGERHIHLLLNQLGLPHLYVDTGTEKLIQYRRKKQLNE